MVLVTFNITMSGNTILLVTPRVHSTSRGDDSSVSRAAGNLTHDKADESFDALGSCVAGFISVTQFAIHSSTPSEEVATTRDSCSVIGAACYLYNYLPSQALCDTGDVFPSIIAMTQTAIISTSLRSQPSLSNVQRNTLVVPTHSADLPKYRPHHQS